jgi:hypothetical protein
VSAVVRSLLAPSGSTGNNTHTSIGFPDVNARYAMVLDVEAVGATPTITWKVQVSIDDTSVSDANSTWYDLLYVTPTTNDTAVTTTRVVTAVGSDVVFPDTFYDARFWRKIRLVTTANTNVTYRGELVSQYRK